MGNNELRRYLAGETLRNGTDWHRDGHNLSTSKGFCFFPSDPPPESRLHYVSGVVDFDIVAEFQVVGCPRLKEGQGTYRDPGTAPPSLDDILSGRSDVPKITVKEYSMPAYSRNTLRLMRVGTVIIGPEGWEIVWSP